MGWISRLIEAFGHWQIRLQAYEALAHPYGEPPYPLTETEWRFLNENDPLAAQSR